MGNSQEINAKSCNAAVTTNCSKSSCTEQSSFCSHSAHVRHNTHVIQHFKSAQQHKNGEGTCLDSQAALAKATAGLASQKDIKKATADF